jgi:hypothetical protein
MKRQQSMEQMRFRSEYFQVSDFLYVTPRSFVLQSWKKKRVPPKRRYLPTRLYAVKFQKTVSKDTTMIRNEKRRYFRRPPRSTEIHADVRTTRKRQ